MSAPTDNGHPRPGVVPNVGMPVVRARAGWRRRARYKRRRGMPPELLAFTGALREAGATWVQIAAAVREEFKVTMLAGMRLAHGWSQRDAAEAWNARWPDEPKTVKNFSYWENWPRPTGYAPSLYVLDRLAQLYQCGIADLLGDRGDYRHLDQAGVGDCREDGHTQMAIGQACPHGCTVLAFTRPAAPAPPEASLYRRWRHTVQTHVLGCYQDNVSARRIAADLGIPDSIVRHLLREAGQPARPGGPAPAAPDRGEEPHPTDTPTGDTGIAPAKSATTGTTAIAGVTGAAQASG